MKYSAMNISIVFCWRMVRGCGFLLADSEDSYPVVLYLTSSGSLFESSAGSARSCSYIYNTNLASGSKREFHLVVQLVFVMLLLQLLLVVVVAEKWTFFEFDSWTGDPACYIRRRR